MSSASAGDSSTFKIGNHEFMIPDNYSSESNIPSWLRNLSGLDKSNEVLISFNADEIAKNVVGYKSMDENYKENIIAVLAVLNSDEIQRINDPSKYKDLWYGTDSYNERVVEPYKNTPDFKVFRKIDYPHYWTVLSRYPDATTAIPANRNDFWVAQCLVMGTTLVKSGKRTDCTSHVLLGNVVIDFHISEQNLPVISGVKEFIKAKVTSWEKKQEQP
jgi:hypothetical protein